MVRVFGREEDEPRGKSVESDADGAGTDVGIELGVGLGDVNERVLVGVIEVNLYGRKAQLHSYLHNHQFVTKRLPTAGDWREIPAMPFQCYLYYFPSRLGIKVKTALAGIGMLRSTPLSSR